MTAIAEKVKTIIEKVCHPERPNLSDENRPLLEVGLDSLDYASVLMAIEDEYRISLTDQSTENLMTIRQIVDYLAAHTATS